MSAESYLRAIDEVLDGYGKIVEKTKDACQLRSAYESALFNLAHLRPPVELADATRWLRAKGYTG